MASRTIRTIALAAGAGALVLGTAAPAMAVTNWPVSTFPAKVAAAPGDTVALSFTAPDICNTAAWTWSYKVVGQRSGIASAPAVALNCSGTTVSVTLTAATPTTKSGKANSVVKLIATPVAPNAAEAVVLTTVVKVNHGAKPAGKPATNPGKGNKPS